MPSTANCLQPDADADYSKAPEYPFPRALEDGADVLSWVLSQPFYAPAHGLTLSGWSAGGNLCLALSTPTLSAKYGLPIEKAREHIKAGFSIFPCTDATASSVPAKIAGGKDTLPTGTPGITFTADRMQYFFEAYLLGHGNSEKEDKTVLLPELSPLKASDEQLKIWLETPLTIITCELDPLEAEATQFAKRLQAAGGKEADVELLQLKGVAHSWEIRSTHDESKWAPDNAGGYAKRLAYDLIEKKMKILLSL
jgi:putative ergosteryl-3beta-O-L-aspartate hydrolase